MFQPSNIIHQFTIQVSRRLFLSRDGSVAQLMENARKEDARRAGLSPVLVYALIVEGVGTCTIRLLPWANPLPARTFMLQAWAKGSPLGHLPHTLKTGRRFAEAMPWLADFCQSVGVTLVVASGNDRSYNVNQAVAQKHACEAPFTIARWTADSKPIALSALDKLISQQALGPYELMLSPEARQIHADFAAVEKRSLPARAEHVYPLDFKAGPWLLANQGSIAPRSKAAILADLGRAAFLADEMGDGLADMPSPAEGDFTGNYAVPELLWCWPEPAASVAKRVGVSTRDLNWYLEGKRGLSVLAVSRLLELFGLEPSEDLRCGDGSLFYEACGNYVLFAPDKPKYLIATYETLTRGGDCRLSVEVLPDKGSADPSWRYLVAGDYLSTFVVAFRRGSAAAEALDQAGTDGPLINYTGQYTVPSALYRATVRLCADVAASPGRMFVLVSRYLIDHEEAIDDIEDRCSAVGW